MNTSYRAGSGEPLVLLHGAAMSWRAWRPVLPGLEAHHDVYVPTLAGHRGGSRLTVGVRASVAALVDGVCADLDAEGIESAHVVGNSLGGWVALELARRGRARSVVALSPAGGWSRSFDLLRLVWLFRIGLAVGTTPLARRALHHESLRRWLLKGAMEHGERIPDADLDDILDDLRDCVVIDELLAGAAALGPLGPLDEISCPVRIAWAEHDHVVPWRSYGRPFRRTVPSAEFVRVPAVGHLPMYDDPDMVTRVILQVTAPAGQPARRSAG